VPAQLTYNIAEETLTGNIAGTVVNCLAGSGGRAGSKVPGAVNWYLQNNALATSVHKEGTHIFGPLPQGSYYMRPHESDKNMVRLDPFSSNYMYGRSGFLIHGRGKIGSHGCIVPYDFSNVLKIRAAVEAYLKLNKSKPVLNVIAVGCDLDMKSSTG